MKKLILLTVIAGLNFGGVHRAWAAPQVANPAFHRENETRVELSTEDGMTIVGTYYRVVDARTKAPGVILAHQMNATRESWHEWARLMQAKGYSVLTIDLRGFGESTVTLTGKVRASDKLNDSKFFNLMTYDIKAAYEHLMRDPMVEHKDIVVMGASIGANAALKFAAKNPEIKAVVLLSPGLDYRGLKTDDAMKTYKGRPVLIMAAADDTYSADSAKKLAGIGGASVKLELSPSGGHGTDLIKGFKAFDDIVLGWLNRTLHPKIMK